MVDYLGKELENAACNIVDSFDNYGEVLQTDINGTYGPNSDIEILRKAIENFRKETT